MAVAIAPPKQSPWHRVQGLVFFAADSQLVSEAVI
jgi:hypothetical protein